MNRLELIVATARPGIWERRDTLPKRDYFQRAPELTSCANHINICGFAGSTVDQQRRYIAGIGNLVKANCKFHRARLARARTSANTSG